MTKKLLSLAALATLTLQAIGSTTIYVSPSGNDSAKGTLDAPLKSITAAQSMVRSAVASGAKGDIEVVMRGGRYEVDRTVVLSFPDVPKDGTLTFKSYGDERPVLSAGREVTGWKKCSTYPEGTPAVAKGNLYVADIPEGVDDFKTLFKGEQRLTRSRSEKFTMPKNDSVRIADSQNVLLNKDRIHLRMMPYDNQLREWENLSDIEVFFNPVPWCLNFIALESIDTERKIAYMAYEANAMPFTNEKYAYCFVENAIDYLDEPGEWCVDTYKGKIYYWSEDGEPKEIYAPMMREIIKVEGKVRYDLQTDIPVKGINFEGLTFTHGDRSVWYKNRKGWGIQHDWDTFDYDNAMLRFRAAESCIVDGCLFTNSGGSAVRLDLHAQKITIRNSMISDVGHMGVLLAGYGPGTKDVNKENIIENNIIQRCGTIIWHGHGIFAWQSGSNIIRNNYIHDVPRKAIGLCGVRCQILMKHDNNFDEASQTIRWNEIERTIDSTEVKIIERYAPFLHARNNIVERNHVERTMLLLSDGSSINVSGAGLGNVVRNNYLYDIPYVGIRTDDWQDGTIIEGNILHKVGKVGVTYKGTNTMRNNVMIDCAKAIHFRSYPKQYFESENTVIQNNIIYSDLEKFEPNSVFKWGNMEVSNKGKKPMPYEYEMDYNAYWFKGATEDLELKRNNGIEAHGVVMNPQFKNLAKRDYRIGNKKLIEAIGFKPFECSLDSFGITTDYPKWLSEKDSTLQ
ncbi:MAG: right-handed parallel beta-helix repeat-containing protein [Rikenellaceae bacterium]